MEKSTIIVRSVWAWNVDQEFSIIRSIVNNFPFVAIDTEFPGVLYVSDRHPSRLTPEQRYALIKRNVDSLSLIQVGITLTDAHGRLPDLGSPTRFFAWEFNLAGFDPRFHPHNPDSIKLLESHGINFDLLRCCGINSRWFAQLLRESGLLCNTAVKWVTFHSAYDFAYLVKELIGGGWLPETMGAFMKLVDFYFGARSIYDMKFMMRRCDGLYGGLEKMANLLNVDREVGVAHQAGSDALLTGQVFKKLREVYFANGGVETQAGVIFGLQVN